MDIQNTGLSYKTAQNILVYSKNKNSYVNTVINQLAIDKPDNFISYKIFNKNDKLNLPLPEGITVKEALEKYIDLSCQINADILSKLVIFLTDSEQKQKISDILQNKEKMSKFLEKRYNLTDFISEYNSLRLSLQDLCEIFPNIAPRYYTCCSSMSKNKNVIELIITLVSWKGVNDTLRFGLTSNYFNDLYQNKTFKDKEEFVEIAVKDSSFKLPKDPSTPLLMICTGSGIAPFISFLQEMESNKNNSYESYLIYGSKNRKNDFIFKKELEEYKKNKILTECYTAFSRDQDHKIYVQDVLVEKFSKEKIKDLVVDKKMNVYVCGSSSMGNTVLTKLKELLGEENNEKMLKNGQLMSELWENN